MTTTPRTTSRTTVTRTGTKGTTRATARATNEPPKRAVIYVRQSLDMSGEELAVDRQEAACRAYCRAMGWTVVKVYRENDTSASGKVTRKHFEQMLADAAAGKFDVMVAMFLDRLTRSVEDLLPLVSLYREHGVATATVRDGIDLTTDTGELVATILAAVAKMEIRRKGQRQVEANHQRAEAGEPHIGGARPIGYDAVMENKRRVNWKIRESEARVIRQAYADLLAGRGLSAIARDLNEAGLRTTKLKTKRAGVWTHGAVADLLRNPRYAGQRVHRGEVVGPAAWKGIVDEPTWRAACAILADPARRTNQHAGGTRRHLGVSLYLCGLCADGTTMVTWIGSAKGNRTTRKYQCRDGKHLVRAGDPIDLFVVDAILERLSRKDARKVLVDHDRPNIRALQAEATDLRTDLDNLAAQRGKREITDREWQIARSPLRDRLDEVEEQMTHTDRSGLLAGLVAAKDKRAEWEGYELDKQRAIVNALCRVTVHRARSGGDPRLFGADRPIQPGTVTVDFHV